MAVAPSQSAAAPVVRPSAGSGGGAVVRLRTIFLGFGGRRRGRGGGALFLGYRIGVWCCVWIVRSRPGSARHPEPCRRQAAVWVFLPLDFFALGSSGRRRRGKQVAVWASGDRVVARADARTLIRRATFDLTGLPTDAGGGGGVPHGLVGEPTGG